VFVAVDFAVVEVSRVGEVGLERQVLAALLALEALLVEDHLVDRSDLLHLVDAIAASRALVGRRRLEQVAKAFWGGVGGAKRRRDRHHRIFGRHFPIGRGHLLLRRISIAFSLAISFW